MSKINCGIGELKKGERRGTMKECAEKGQVRYYGLKKIDSRILKASKKVNKGMRSRNQLLKKIMSLKARILAYKKKIKEEDNINKKDVLKNKTRNLLKEYKEYKLLYDKLEEKK
jgi:hypothetical protein